jgi:hypothetical protein
MSKKKLTAKSTKGVTVLGMLFYAMVVIFVVIISINLVPPYMQHYEVKESLNALAKDPNVRDMSKAKIKDYMARRFQINSVRNVAANDLEIEKRDGKMYLSLHYEVRVHMVANIDAIIKFDDQAMVE